MRATLGYAIFSLTLLGCATQDIAQVSRGKVFARTGALKFYSGETGLVGPVLGPGTYHTGMYNELRTVNCATMTARESLDTLTLDGVHFGFDFVVRFKAECSDAGVAGLLGAVSPDDGHEISTKKLYETFVKPSIGQAAREFVSPYHINELFAKQAQAMAGVQWRFYQLMKERAKDTIVVQEVNITNLQFPEAMDKASAERAVQAVLRDKAVAERERVQAEVLTMEMKRQLAEKEADVTAAKIERIGLAVRKNPEYLQYDLQLKLPDIYRELGSQGNMILGVPDNLQLVLPARGARQPQVAPRTAASVPGTPHRSDNPY
jgi:regulator of protease activity HflC (stomatin/prohibitin superfamily)